ncbi:unnamed protein product [Prorocentrum cordatum]|uniref:Ankyrin repeat domain-containing protein n=1 Tax=Prorocentrum cordatum TaxID=2364126 RepID=A0ABN9PWR3_9DINO|nr:unnamed protein product [Polarella glacialis]
MGLGASAAAKCGSARASEPGGSSTSSAASPAVPTARAEDPPPPGPPRQGTTPPGASPAAEGAAPPVVAASPQPGPEAPLGVEGAAASQPAAEPAAGAGSCEVAPEAGLPEPGHGAPPGGEGAAAAQPAADVAAESPACTSDAVAPEGPSAPEGPGVAAAADADAAVAGAGAAAADVQAEGPSAEAEAGREAASARLVAAVEAEDWEAVEGLLRDPAAPLDVNATSDWGYALLRAAAEEGALGACRLLLGRGADPNSRDQNGMTPLMGCSREGGRAHTHGRSLW